METYCKVVKYLQIEGSLPSSSTVSSDTKACLMCLVASPTYICLS